MSGARKKSKPRLLLLGIAVLIVACILLAGKTLITDGDHADRADLVEDVVPRTPAPTTAMGEPGDPNPTETETFRLSQLQAVVDEFIGEHAGVLGVVARLDLGGESSLAAAAGHFDISRETSIRCSDQFSVGSTTKMFTATLVFQLVEEGKVDLDDAIIKHIPAQWKTILADVEYGDQVTVGQALSHRSGLYDYIINVTFFYGLLESKDWTPLGLLKLVKDEGSSNSAPGSSYRYCNTNYLLLGALVEEVTGQPLKKVFEDRVFSKGELKNTFFSEGRLGSGRPGIAHGYFTEQGKLYDMQEFDSGWAWAAGGIISNTEDLNRFVRSLATGELYGSSEIFERMAHLPPGNDHYAHGIMSRTHPTFGRFYSHSGYDGATSSVVCYYPERGLVVSACINYNGTPTRLRAIHLTDTIMSRVGPGGE